MSGPLKTFTNQEIETITSEFFILKALHQLSEKKNRIFLGLSATSVAYAGQTVTSPEGWAQRERMEPSVEEREDAFRIVSHLNQLMRKLIKKLERLLNDEEAKFKGK